MAQTKENLTRLHYMDNLRALIMIAGVFFHAALAYSLYMHEIWLSADPLNTPFMDWLVSFLHSFRMPLFFVIAGFFAAMLVRRKGMVGMLKNRALRILLPLIIFWPLIYMAIVFPVGWAINNVENLSPLLTSIKVLVENPDSPRRTPTLAHLWFLYYLVFFYILVRVCHWLPLGKLKRLVVRLHPITATLIFPLLLIPSLLITSTPFPPPDHFTPQLWVFGFFGLFFAYGYTLFSSTRHLDFYQRRWPLLVLISLILSRVMLMFLPEHVGFKRDPPFLIHLIIACCTAYIAVCMCFAGLVCARQFLGQRNAFMRFMSDASYWIYLIHLPITLAIQYWLMDQSGGVTYKYAVSVVGTLAICILTYPLAVRFTPIGKLLNGKRHSLRPANLQPNKCSSDKF